MNKNTTPKRAVPVLFEVPRTSVICVLALTTLILIALFGLDQLKLVLALVAGAILFSFVMDAITSVLVRIICDVARGIGRGLGYIIAAFRDC